MKLSAFLSITLFACLFQPKAHADLVLTMYENSGNVVTSWSGDVHTDLLPAASPFGVTAGQVRGQFNLWFGFGNESTVDLIRVDSATGVTFDFTNPSPSFFAFVGTPTGVSIGMQANSSNAGFLFLPENYVSGSQISGSSTIAGTFASLNIQDGVTSTATWNSAVDGVQTMTFITDADFVSVPEPTSCALFTLAFGSGVALRRRRKVN